MTEEQAYKQMIARLPMGRPAEPDEIANIVVFAASERGRYLTGANINTDGAASHVVVLRSNGHGPGDPRSRRARLARQHGNCHRPRRARPWQQNESRYDYVRPTVAIDERGNVAIAWVDQKRKDVFFGKQGEAVNVSRSPHTLSWLPRCFEGRERFRPVAGDHLFRRLARRRDAVRALQQRRAHFLGAAEHLSDSVAGDGKAASTRITGT